MEEPAGPVVVEEKGSRGCLYGCLFVVFGGIALVVCAGVGTYWFLSSQVEKYTSKTPVELPTVEFEPEKLAELESRLEKFTEAFEKDQTPEEDLVLTADEINAMIAKEEKLRGKVFVKIEDGKVTGDLSVPTDAVPGGKGRFFNGSASFNVSMDGGVLIVTLADAEVNGQAVPQQFTDAMASENLAQELYKDPKNAKVLRRFESVKIEENKIILKLRRDETPAEEPEEPESEAEEAEPEAGPQAEVENAQEVELEVSL